MVCDIHLHIEVKIDGQWEHYAAPSVTRHYACFSKMAGVRNADNDIVPISEPKGMPDGVSNITAFSCEHWDGDGHSHSWLDAKEISEFSKWFDETAQSCFYSMENWLSTYLEGNGMDLIEYPDENPEYIEDIRFVFWFDN